MGKVNDSLMYLLDTKKCIKNAISGKGIPIDDNVTFREYAEKIELIGEQIRIESVTQLPDVIDPNTWYFIQE